MRNSSAMLDRIHIRELSPKTWSPQCLEESVAREFHIWTEQVKQDGSGIAKGAPCRTASCELQDKEETDEVVVRMTGVFSKDELELYI